MALEDIGYMIFAEFLGMAQYPGDPFTGNIYRDLIMFLLVPTIFIIMILYIMSGRIIPDKKFRIMLGVGAYLFIIAGGYYSFFALLAGPYFIFLIFILGVLGYLMRHFRPSGGGYSGGGGGFSRGEPGREASKVRAGFNTEQRADIKEDIEDLEDDIKKLEKEKRKLEDRRTDELASGSVDRRAVATLEDLINKKDEQIREKEDEIRDLERQLRIIPRHRF